MDIRFSIDPETHQPHIYEHGVTEEEVAQVLMRPGDDFQGRRNTRIKFGQTLTGPLLEGGLRAGRRTQQRLCPYRL